MHLEVQSEVLLHLCPLLPMLGLSHDSETEITVVSAASLQVTKPMPAISCLPKPSFVRRLCIAGQLNLADYIMSCNHKHLPMHFWAQACRISSELYPVRVISILDIYCFVHCHTYPGYMICCTDRLHVLSVLLTHN